MGLGRNAPHRNRAAYARALAQIPLPVRAITAPAEEALTVLDTAVIGGRTIQFGTLTTAPRLWVAFTDQAPPVFGYLTGLVAEQPILHLTAETHCEWTNQPAHTEALKQHGLEVWRTVQRTCEG